LSRGIRVGIVIAGYKLLVKKWWYLGQPSRDAPIAFLVNAMKPRHVDIPVAKFKTNANKLLHICSSNLGECECTNSLLGVFAFMSI
jgi:hypothetical protein